MTILGSLKGAATVAPLDFWPSEFPPSWNRTPKDGKIKELLGERYGGWGIDVFYVQLRIEGDGRGMSISQPNRLIQRFHQPLGPSASSSIRAECTYPNGHIAHYWPVLQSEAVQNILQLRRQQSG